MTQQQIRHFTAWTTLISNLKCIFLRFKIKRFVARVNGGRNNVKIECHILIKCYPLWAFNNNKKYILKTFILKWLCWGYTQFVHDFSYRMKMWKFELHFFFYIYLFVFSNVHTKGIDVKKWKAINCVIQCFWIVLFKKYQRMPKFIFEILLLKKYIHKIGRCASE